MLNYIVFLFVTSSYNKNFKKNPAFCSKCLNMSKDKDVRLIGFGEHVRHLRESLKMSQDEVVANSEKLTKATLSEIENGKRNAAITTLIDLAKGLNLHPKQLFDFDY